MAKADELGPIIRKLLAESIKYDPEIHSKLCSAHKLEQVDMNTLFPNLIGFDIFNNGIKTTN